VICLTLPELLHVAVRALGSEPAVRDYGLLGSALARPQATAFGQDAYPDLDARAAALLHSLARNHAFTDGNKRPLNRGADPSGHGFPPHGSRFGGKGVPACGDGADAAV
jgi:hypothetical protein